MKTATSLSKSAEHCLKRALAENENVKRGLQKLAAGAPLEKVMPCLRLEILEVEKNIHEFNAYRNAMDTD